MKSTFIDSEYETCFDRLPALPLYRPPIRLKHQACNPSVVPQHCFETSSRRNIASEGILEARDGSLPAVSFLSFAGTFSSTGMTCRIIIIKLSTNSIEEVVFLRRETTSCEKWTQAILPQSFTGTSRPVFPYRKKTRQHLYLRKLLKLFNESSLKHVDGKSSTGAQRKESTRALTINKEAPNYIKAKTSSTHMTRYRSGRQSEINHQNDKTQESNLTSLQALPASASSLQLSPMSRQNVLLIRDQVA